MTGSEEPLADYLYERLAPQCSADFGDTRSGKLFTADSAPQDSAIQPERTARSAARAELTDRYQRFPELRPDVPFTESFPIEPQSDLER